MVKATYVGSSMKEPGRRQVKGKKRRPCALTTDMLALHSETWFIDDGKVKEKVNT
jgi:hypothetical protein